MAWYLIKHKDNFTFNFTANSNFKLFDVRAQYFRDLSAIYLVTE